MSIHKATEVVLSAAQAHANGHQQAAEILEAVNLLRAYMNDQDEEEHDA